MALLVAAPVDVVLAARLSNEKFIVRCASRMLAGVDDELTVRAQRSFLARKGVLVEIGHTQIPMNLRSARQPKGAYLSFKRGGGTRESENGAAPFSWCDSGRGRALPRQSRPCATSSVLIFSRYYERQVGVKGFRRFNELPFGTGSAPEGKPAGLATRLKCCFPTT